MNLLTAPKISPVLRSEALITLLVTSVLGEELALTASGDWVAKGLFSILFRAMHWPGHGSTRPPCDKSSLMGPCLVFSRGKAEIVLNRTEIMLGPRRCVLHAGNAQPIKIDVDR